MQPSQEVFVRLLGLHSLLEALDVGIAVAQRHAPGFFDDQIDSLDRSRRLFGERDR